MNKVVVPLYRVRKDGPADASFDTLQKLAGIAAWSAKRHIVDADEVSFFGERELADHAELDKAILRDLRAIHAGKHNVLYFEADAVCVRPVNLFGGDKVKMFAFASRSAFPDVPKGVMLNSAVLYIPATFDRWDVLEDALEHWDTRWAYFQYLWSKLFYEQFPSVEAGREFVLSQPAGKYNYAPDYVDNRVTRDEADIFHLSLSRGYRKALSEARGLVASQVVPAWSQVDPLISVIIPSRGRPEGLLQSLKSLQRRASGRVRVEYLVKLDHDDWGSIAWLPELRDCKVLLSDKRAGYADLHYFVNDLARLARGKWVWLLNDDSEVLTDGWDEIIAGRDAESIWVLGCDDGDPTCNLFPIVTKKMIEVLGHFSMSAHNDTYVEKISEALGRAVEVPIQVKHNRTDMRDETYLNSNAAYAHTRKLFKSKAVQDELQKDITRLKKWIAKKR